MVRRENMCLVPGSLWSILTLFENKIFVFKVLWMVGECEMNSIGFFVV